MKSKKSNNKIVNIALKFRTMPDGLVQMDSGDGKPDYWYPFDKIDIDTLLKQKPINRFIIDLSQMDIEMQTKLSLALEGAVLGKHIFLEIGTVPFNSEV
jgi:hypothetical protein